MEPVQYNQAYEIKQAISKLICSSCGQEYVFAQGITKCPADGALLAPVMHDPFIGKLLVGKYEILSLIGSGGYAQVYLAKHLDLDRNVAIKMLGLHLVSDLDSVKRFENEAKVIGLLRHKNIVEIHDYGLLPQPFLVMEYIEGVTLEKFCAGKAQPLKEAFPVIAQICDAMENAHKAGIVHRDLKPSNIMLLKSEHETMAKILDFGVSKLTSEAMQSISRLTQSGETMGSPPYMSPEQCQGRTLDGRADIYSLGCLIYEMLCGDKPFGGGNPVELMHKHMSKPAPDINQEHPELALPFGVAYVIKKAMAKDPDDRYQSMSELYDDMKAAVELNNRQFKEKIRHRGKLVSVKRGGAFWKILAASALVLSPLFFYFIYNSSPKLEKAPSRLEKNAPELLSKIDKAEQCLRQNAIQQALALAQEAVADCKESAAAFAILAAAQLKQAEQFAGAGGVTRSVPYENAIANASEAIKLDNSVISAYLTRLRANCKVGKFEAAIADCRYLDKVMPSSSALPKVSRALIFAESGSVLQAKELLDASKTMDTDASSREIAEQTMKILRQNEEKKDKPERD